MVLGGWVVTNTGVGPDLTPYAQTTKANTMAQWVKAPATKSDDQSSSSQIYVVERATPAELSFDFRHKLRNGHAGR